MELKNYIAGEFKESLSGKWLDVEEPATGRKYAKVPLSNAEDVELAVESARSARGQWGDLSFEERSDWLTRIADGLELRREEIASLESRDTGKPITLARNVDAERSISNFRFFAEMLKNHRGEEFEMSDAMNYVSSKPVGVGALITPWNLPLYLLSWKVAPAIGMGNTVICKPSELTPMTANLLMEVIDEIGLPAGVVNLVHGDGGGAGSRLVGHPGVDLVSFTGGTATGAEVARTAAPQFKKISLELGGKNASIVFGDCDLDATVKGVTRSAFLNQGQVCLCGSRVLVERPIYEDFKHKFVQSVEGLRIGDPASEDTELGAIISRGHLEKVEGYVALSITEGGVCLTGGPGSSVSLEDRLKGGNWMRPVVVEGLPVDSRCSTEEIFGPMVTIHPFDGEEMAIEIANNTRYGLAGSVWTTDLEKGRRVAENMRTGMVWVNTWLHRDLRTPFGGVKDSGVGREGGKWSLGFFSEPLNVCIKDNSE